MEEAKAPQLYPVCPYRNVEAAFARFYDAAPEPRLSAVDGKSRLHVDDIGDWLHRLVLKRRALRLALAQRHDSCTTESLPAKEETPWHAHSPYRFFALPS